jgi:hypothetical protein
MTPGKKSETDSASLPSIAIACLPCLLTTLLRQTL